MDAYEAAGEEAGRKLYKNVESSIKQVLATTPHETPTIRTLAPITKTIQVRRTRHAGTLLEKQDELISDLYSCGPHTWMCKSGTTSTNLHTAAMWEHGCNSEDLPEAMNDREKWRETVRDIRAGGARHDDDDDICIFELLHGKCSQHKPKKYHKISIKYILKILILWQRWKKLAENGEKHLKQNNTSFEESCKILKRWSDSWGREQCWTFRFNCLLEGKYLWPYSSL